MIFKNLFKAKWKNSDPQVRIQSLQDLSPDDNHQKSILHELAFNDGNENVRRKALERLNDFSLWWQASKSENDAKNRALAENNIRKGLLGQASFNVDATLKSRFIDECNKSSILEELALNDSDDNVRLKLLLRLNKEPLFLQAFSARNTSLDIQNALVDAIDQLPLLTRLLTAADGEVKSKIQAKIDFQNELAQKPVTLRKNVNLVLAKLNALKDKNDVELMLTRREALTTEWQACQADFNLLEEDEQHVFNDKYLKIISSLEKVIAPLKEARDQALREAAEKAAIAEQQAALNAEKAAIEESLAKADQNDVDSDAVIAQLKSLADKVSGMTLDNGFKTNFLSAIDKLIAQAEKLPEIRAKLAEATRLIAQLAAIAIPESVDSLQERFAQFKDIRQQWRDNLRGLDIKLPAEISASWKTLDGNWKAATDPLLQKQNDLFKQTRKKMGELKGLINAGRYKSAFGLHKKMTFWFDELADHQKEKLDRDYQAINEEVEKLKGLQAYIATPRKQSLIEEMTELAESPMSDPAEQPKRVKLARQTWMTLGKADEELEESLNQTFNELCEKAFVICREYYSEKEKQRDENLALRKAVIDTLTSAHDQLNADDKNWSELESLVAKAGQEWRKLGEVDRSVVNEINQQFNDAINPLKQALQQQYQVNAEAKQAIIAKATALKDADDLSEATETLKALQGEWKGIGFSGANLEKQLWKQFRAINDDVFAKRNEQKKEQQQAQQSTFETLMDKVDGVIDEAKEVLSVSSLNEQTTALKSLVADHGLTGKLATKLQAKVSQQLQNISHQIDNLRDDKARKAIADVFTGFEQVSAGEALPDDITLTSADRALITALSDNADVERRHELTLTIEILANVESPEADKPRRMEIQLAMLSEKLNAGTLDQLDGTLRNWMAVGRLTDSEHALYERVKAVFGVK